MLVCKCGSKDDILFAILPNFTTAVPRIFAGCKKKKKKDDQLELDGNGRRSSIGAPTFSDREKSMVGRAEFPPL